MNSLCKVNDSFFTLIETTANCLNISWKLHKKEEERNSSKAQFISSSVWFHPFSSSHSAVALPLTDKLCGIHPPYQEYSKASGSVARYYPFWSDFWGYVLTSRFWKAFYWQRNPVCSRYAQATHYIYDMGRISFILLHHTATHQYRSWASVLRVIVQGSLILGLHNTQGFVYVNIIFRPLRLNLF